MPLPALALLGQEVVPLENQVKPPGMVGQEEVQIFRFTALAPGEVALDVTKSRPWEKQPQEERLLVLLAVSEK